MERARDAGLLIGGLATVLLLRWALQHHVPNANDAQFFWFVMPIYLLVDWWKLARARRANAWRAGARDQDR